MPASDQWGDDSLHDLLSLSQAPKGMPTLHERHIHGASTGAKFTAPAAVGMGLGGDGASGQAEEQ